MPAGTVRSCGEASPLTSYPHLEAHVAKLVRGRPAAQQPSWPDPERARAVCAALRQAPPIVTADEVDRLRDHLAKVARGAAFLLQCGPCAETFATAAGPGLRADVALLRELTALLRGARGSPIVPVGRMAGQFGKPRSKPVDALGLPAYRGDIVNSAEPDPAARVPDPERMLRAHATARKAMHLIQTERDRDDTEIFAAHEALVVDYEQNLLRVGRHSPFARLYSASAHFLWIGERTRQLDGAHVALAELMANPVGVKLGPTATAEQAVAYARRLDPHRTPGRLTFISRMGRDRVRDVLPPIVERVTAAGHPVIWVCDPMHGNTGESPTGYKTRRFDDVVEEVRVFFEVHRQLGSHPGGLHIETTGDDVTECLGGAQGLSDTSLPARYETACDPRLNARQSAELALLVSELR